MTYSAYLVHYIVLDLFWHSVRYRVFQKMPDEKVQKIF